MTKSYEPELMCNELVSYEPELMCNELLWKLSLNSPISFRCLRFNINREETRNDNLLFDAIK